MRSPNSDVMEPVVRALCEHIDTPRSLATWLCFKYNQAALLELPNVAVATCDTGRFASDYFITEYLSKYKGLKTRINKRQVALEKWRLSESLCLETNKRFKFGTIHPSTGCVEEVLFRTQRKIGSVLGPFEWPLVLADCKWGPGATYDLDRKSATPDKKISGAISVTAQALPLMREMLDTDPHWIAAQTGIFPDGLYSSTSLCFNVVRGSRFLTVPKSAKTDRCIAAEPTGNSFLQQGVHSYIRRRLKRFGVNLDDQSINQEAARTAPQLGLATLDLSMASDTISRELVYHLLPLDWALFLDKIRSPETFVDGEWIRTEKFASMGNAFCFELETLIFWALACSVSEIILVDRGGFKLGSVGRVSVYGDDIIIDRRVYNELVSILAYCGFVVNEKKSFKDGYFFESCGKHYHRGFDVTPTYQKELVIAPSEIIRAHNRIIRLASRVPTLGLHSALPKVLRNFTSRYKFRPFPRIPFGVSEDGGFLRPLSEFPLDQNHGFRCHVLDFKPRYTSARENAVYAYKMRRFSHMNVLRNGHAGNSTHGTWRTRVRWIPEIATLDDPLSNVGSPRT